MKKDLKKVVFLPTPKIDIRNGPPLEPPTLFDIAKKLVYGDRQKQYGDFKKGYEAALQMYNVWKGVCLDDGCGNMHAVDGVDDLMMLMVFIKLSREANQPKEDNIVDAIGYLEMYYRAL